MGTFDRLLEVLEKHQSSQIKAGNFDGAKIPINNTIWLSVSEAAKLGGVQTKTIRRALKAELKFKIIKNRYQIELGSLLTFVYSNKKLANKFIDNGLGQYVALWKK
jgi:hypothetical protein